MSEPSVRSPLHASALGLEDLTLGRDILQFDNRHGLTGTYRVVSRPVKNREGFLTVELYALEAVAVRTGTVRPTYLIHMGVVPRSDEWENRHNLYLDTGWHKYRFVVDASDRESLRRAYRLG